MTKTKHIGISADSIEDLARQLNEVGKINDVFATQTHVVQHGERVIYKAVCFARDND